MTHTNTHDSNQHATQEEITLRWKRAEHAAEVVAHASANSHGDLPPTLSLNPNFVERFGSIDPD
jgi:hypothetical protein